MSIESLQEQYYEAIQYLQQENDIKNALPQPDYPSFFPLMTGLLNLLDKDLQENQDLLEMVTSEEEKLEAQELIELTQKKKNWCLELLKKAQKTVKNEAEIKSPQYKNIIYATGANGSTFLEKDIQKNIELEYYSSLASCLNMIREGRYFGDQTRIKRLEHNSKLSGMWEAKEFKVRIFFKIIAKDTLYIFLAKMKKDDNTTLDREEPIKRFKNCQKEYSQLEQLLNDPNIVQEIITTNQQKTEEILTYLSNKGRGRR